MRLGTTLAILLLSAVFLAHLVRFALGWDVVISGVDVPRWVSAAALLVTGFIVFLLWGERRAAQG